MKIVTVIQARMGSKRLPGKAMIKICGKPSLQHVLDRIKPSRFIREIYLATTVNPNDDILEKWAKDNKIKCYRGSETDVLSSYYQIGKDSQADALVRITGDCLLIDYAVIDSVLAAYITGSFACVTNTTPPTYPDGLDVEVFSFTAIEQAWQNAKSDFEREHVNIYIYENPKMFKRKNVANGKNLSKIRWTLDMPEDLKLLELIISECDKTKKYCHLNDILQILEKHPNWQEINLRHERNQGYKIGY